jgi:hypothetical protein
MNYKVKVQLVILTTKGSETFKVGDIINSNDVLDLGILDYFIANKSVEAEKAKEIIKEEDKKIIK